MSSVSEKNISRYEEEKSRFERHEIQEIYQKGNNRKFNLHGRYHKTRKVLSENVKSLLPLSAVYPA